MRNIFTLLLLVLFGTLQLIAGPVSKSQAQKVAETFLQRRGLSVQATQGPAKARMYQSGTTEAAAYYIFNTEGNAGFVIVSGDDRTIPILGYTDNGVYDESTLPANFKSWMDSYVEQIEQLGDVPQTSTANTTLQSTPYNPSWAAISPLLRTKWDQGAPYNTLCPVINGVKTVTGCVATAMAQIMYYHKWPQEATTAIPAYTQGNFAHQELSPKVFEWDNMPLTSAETDVNNAVATLMRYAGQAVNMTYGPESGAMDRACSPALVNYFDYDPGIKLAFRGSSTCSEWHTMVYEELANDRPVLYIGDKTSSSHAFICDGYDGNGLYHINWGWGGIADGYFVLEILNPNASGTGGGALGEGFMYYQRALLGVKPNTGAPRPAQCLTTNVLTVDGTRIYADFWNYGLCQTSFEFGVGYERNGTYIPLMAHNVSNLGIGYGWNWNVFDFTLESAHFSTPGTYRVAPICREIMDGAEWEPTLSPSIYVEVIVGENGEMSLIMHPTSVLKVKDVKATSKASRFSECTLEVTVENTGEEGMSPIYMFVSQTDEKGYYHSESANTVFMPGATVTVPIRFIPQVGGSCKLRFSTDAEGTNIIGQSDIEVEDVSYNLEGRCILENNHYLGYMIPTLDKTIRGNGWTSQRAIWEIKYESGGYTLQNVVTGLYAKPGNGASAAWTLSEEPVTLYCYVNDGGVNGTITFGNGDPYGKMHQDGAGNIVNWCTQRETNWSINPISEPDEQMMANEREYLKDEIGGAQEVIGMFGEEMSIDVNEITLKDLIDNKIAYKVLQGKYLRFTNTKQGKAVGINAQYIPAGVNASSKDMNQIWQIVPSGTGFKFFNPNMAAASETRAYLGGMHAGSPAQAAQMCSEADAQVYTIRVLNTSAGTFRFAYGSDENECINMEGSGYASGNYILDSWGGDASIFTATQVEEVEVDLENLLSGKACASVYLPFDVKKDADNVKVYVGKSISGNTLNIAETTSVKALNGFILESPNAATATLRIVPDENATESLLQGTTQQLSIINTANRINYLLLGKDETTQTPGFYPLTGNTIPGNTAFVGNGSRLYDAGLSIYSIPTGIEEIHATPSEGTAIYDLTGRRVFSPNRKGIYIQDGKKILR